MRDRNLKANIKKTKDFISLWVKFHDLYRKAIKKEAISQEEENLFLETKHLIDSRYEALKEALELGTSGNGAMMDIVSRVLSLKSVASMSDEALGKVERHWERSYTFLNKLLKDLEEKGQLPRKKILLPKFLKHIFYNKIIQVIALIIAVFIMAYLLNVLIKLIVK